MAESEPQQDRERPYFDPGQKFESRPNEVWSVPESIARRQAAGVPAAPPTDQGPIEPWAPPPPEAAAPAKPEPAPQQPREPWALMPTTAPSPTTAKLASTPPDPGSPAKIPTPVPAPAPPAPPRAGSAPPGPPSGILVPPPPAAPPDSAETPWSFSGNRVHVPSSPFKAVGVVALVVALVAGVARFAPRPEHRGHPLALTFVAGRDYRYRFHGILDGSTSAGQVTDKAHETFKGTLLLHVVRVDLNGVSTVRMSFVDASLRVNGKSHRIGSKLGGKMRIAPDGRILRRTGVMTTADGSATVMTGLNQLTPLLPSSPVSSGATWTTKFAQNVPYGDRPLEITAKNDLVNYDTVGGVSSAVVTSDIKMPVALSIDVRKLLESSGGTVDPQLANARLAVSGNLSLFQTSWLDPVAKELTESSILGHVDLTVQVEGLGSPGAAVAPARFQGTLTLQIDRIRSGAGDSPADDPDRDTLRRALAAADLYFAAAHTYRGFTPSKASGVAPSLQWRAGGKTAPGVVTIRMLSADSVLLLTRDRDGHPMCIARTPSGMRYGRNGATGPAGCRGGW